MAAKDKKSWDYDEDSYDNDLKGCVASDIGNNFREHLSYSNFHYLDNDIEISLFDFIITSDDEETDSSDEENIRKRKRDKDDDGWSSNLRIDIVCL